ncbi:ATP-binding cassette domain-containing protein [Limibacter armeniacum]|uniref:ABC transporter ATP-binding protein n=1 Tax=Limibacter armeniacum TaxID=466084 RepID=UPI002FE576A3
MIEIKNIKKSFNGKEILKGINATFEQGRTNMIIGASGTGKSVLLKCIVGLIEPDEGAVEFNGRNFYKSDRETKKQIRREIGMLFQGGALFDSKTVAENVRFPLDMLTTMPLDEKLDRVNTCLKRVGLDHAMERMPSEISGGMQKRVGIARAIVMNSQYLFCDEPNSGLDPNTSLMIDNLIHEITHEYNLTTIVVSHDMNSVMEIGEYIMFMHEGHKLWEGNNDNILDADCPELQKFLFSNKLVRKFKEEH